jgi:peptidyl-prolyl cis-trans isomerase B (cyclophilin B)
MTLRRLPLLALLLVAITACGDDAPSASTAATTAVTTTAPAPGTIDSPAYLAFREQPTACGAERPAAAREMTFAAPEDLELTGVVTAILHTSCGDITIELTADVAPTTVSSFVFLAEQGYFDGTLSHRIYPGFVVQLGDPTATGRGSPGYRIVDELPAGDFLYVGGTVAMANSGPDTGGSQFFITLATAPGLEPNYTVFGHVTAGLDVLNRIGTIRVGINPNSGEPSYPLDTLYIERVTIQR